MDTETIPQRPRVVNTGPPGFRHARSFVTVRIPAQPFTWPERWPGIRDVVSGPQHDFVTLDLDHAEAVVTLAALYALGGRRCDQRGEDLASL